MKHYFENYGHGTQIDESIPFDEKTNDENAPNCTETSLNHGPQIASPDGTPMCKSSNDSSRSSSGNLENLHIPSKGLHYCNLNVCHLIPKMDEFRIVMATGKCPDILGKCETFLEPNVPDSQVNLASYDFFTKG